MDTVTEVVQKKPRTEAQMTALENARRKALQMRAQKTALKKQEEADKATAVVEAQKQPIEEPPIPPVEAEEPETPVEPEEEIEYVKKARSRPKPKKRIVVVEESSDEEELEIRLPPKKRKEFAPPPTPEKIDPRFEHAYSKMFSL